MSVASGTYMYSGDGWVATAPGTLAPTSALGLVTIDVEGVVTGTYTQTIAGNVTSGKINGSATVASDCTGTITYYLDSSTAAYELKMVLIPHTGEIHTLFTKTPALAMTMVTRFTRIARNLDTPAGPVEEPAGAARRR